MASRENVLMAGAAFLISVTIRLALAPSFAHKGDLAFDAPLAFDGLAPELAVFGAPAKVRLRASGPADYVNQLDTGSITAHVDLSRARTGTRLYALDPIIRSRVTIEPQVARVRLTVERVASREKEVLVEPTGLPPREFVYGGSSVLPARVAVIGAASAVARVAKVRALLDLTLVRPGAALRLPVELLDDADRPLAYVRAEPSEVSVSPAVATAPAAKSVLVNPTWSGQVKFGFRVSSCELKPLQIRVKGDSGAIARLTTVETEPIRLDGRSASFEETVKVRLPQGVHPVNGEFVTASVKIEPEQPAETTGQ